VSEAPVNWCPGLGTVVANEEVTADGRSDRGNFPVFKRNMRQWMMRITAYADRLLDDLDLLDWTDAIKTMQRNWIGRSDGAEVHFESPAGDHHRVHHPARHAVRRHVHGAGTRAPAGRRADHAWPRAPTPTPERPPYRRGAYRREEGRRPPGRVREKTGVFTGSYAVNPVNGEEIPVFDRRLRADGLRHRGDHGRAGGDQRDFEFAEAFGLPIVRHPVEPPDRGFENHGVEPTPRHGEWPVRTSASAVRALLERAHRPRRHRQGRGEVIRWLEAKGTARHRQLQAARLALQPPALLGRAVPDRLRRRRASARAPRRPMLPVLLPETDVLAAHVRPDDEFSDPEPPRPPRRLGEVELDLGDGRALPARHQRHAAVGGLVLVRAALPRPDQRERFVDPEVERYWMGPRTDGDPTTPAASTCTSAASSTPCCTCSTRASGTRCSTTSGHVSSKEPYARLFNQGYILAAPTRTSAGCTSTRSRSRRNGEYFLRRRAGHREFGKMGKSLKNAVAPDDMYEQYGADTLRLYEMAMGPLDAIAPVGDPGDVVGMYRFLQRLWRNLVDATRRALASERVQALLGGAEPQRVIARPPDVVNLVVR
jgi:leucyl-tRNA synthetase